MPVLEAVHTFAGIANENEFYSHHYLAEVFKGDIKARLDAWEASEAEHPSDDSWRAPAEVNRQELFSMGLWGAPSLRVNDGPGYWGQDRLWLIERDLIAATEAK